MKMKKVSVFLFLAAWLLIGCASTRAGAAEHDTPVAQQATPMVQASPSQSTQPAQAVNPLMPSETIVTSPDIPDTPAVTPTPLPLLPAATPIPPDPRSTPPETLLPTASPALRPTPAPEAWKTWPVVPTLSEYAKSIYLRGQALGRDSHRFSKVGDCQNITTYFLSHFEDPDLYRLGEYASLQPAIDWFMGSFTRESQAVKGGMNVAAVLSPLRANPDYCSQGESPLACEYRLYNPSFAILSMEEAWSGEPEK